MFANFCTCSLQFTKLYFCTFPRSLFSLGQEGNPNPVSARAIQIVSAVLLFILLTIFGRDSGLGAAGIPPLSLFHCPQKDARGALGRWPPSRDLHATPSPSVQPGGITPPGSVATMASRHKRGRLYCAETLKASGTVMTDTMYGGKNPLVIGRHAAEPSNLLSKADIPPALLALYARDSMAAPPLPRCCAAGIRL